VKIHDYIESLPKIKPRIVKVKNKEISLTCKYCRITFHTAGFLKSHKQVREVPKKVANYLLHNTPYLYPAIIFHVPFNFCKHKTYTNFEFNLFLYVYLFRENIQMLQIAQMMMMKTTTRKMMKKEILRFVVDLTMLIKANLVGTSVIITLKKINKRMSQVLQMAQKRLPITTPIIIIIIVFLVVKIIKEIAKTTKKTNQMIVNT
jgi:hypothetical protein